MWFCQMASLGELLENKGYGEYSSGKYWWKARIFSTAKSNKNKHNSQKVVQTISNRSYSEMVLLSKAQALNSYFFINCINLVSGFLLC